MRTLLARELWWSGKGKEALTSIKKQQFCRFSRTYKSIGRPNKRLHDYYHSFLKAKGKPINQHSIGGKPISQYSKVFLENHHLLELLILNEFPLPISTHIDNNWVCFSVFWLPAGKPMSFCQNVTVIVTSHSNSSRMKNFF